MISDFIRFDKEYEKIFNAIKEEKARKLKRSIFISGLCCGASDALLCSHIRDLYDADPTPAIVLCANDKECSRISSLLKSQGITAP